MILNMMLPTDTIKTYDILGTLINKETAMKNRKEIDLLVTLFSNKDSDKIQISDEIPHNITEILNKPINIDIELDQTIHTIMNVYMKGNLKEYNKNIYIAHTQNKINDKNSIITQKYIQTLISSAIQAINIPEWNVGFSLNGFVFFNKPIESQEITNVETYDKKDHLIMVYQDELIKYYDITQAFPEIADQFKLNLTVSTVGIIILGGIYLIMNNDDTFVPYKQEFQEKTSNNTNETENTYDQDVDNENDEYKPEINNEQEINESNPLESITF